MDALTNRRVSVNDVEVAVSVTNEGGPRGLALLVHGFPELRILAGGHQIPVHWPRPATKSGLPTSRGYGNSVEAAEGRRGVHASIELLADHGGPHRPRQAVTR